MVQLTLPKGSKPTTGKVYKAPAGSRFDLSTWTGSGGEAYTLRVEKGAITSSRGERY